MGLRFRQSFTLFPGVRLNLGKRGISASIGVPGATLNLSARGARGTVGIPGTGLSYSSMLSPTDVQSPIAEPKLWTPPSHLEPAMPRDGMREIGSSAVASLTSPGLHEFRAMIVDAHAQRREIEFDLSEARAEHARRKIELLRKKRSILRVFFRRRIAELEESLPVFAKEVERLESWLKATYIDMRLNADDLAQRSYNYLVHTYESLRSCRAIWDVTRDRDADQKIERTSAARSIERTRVVLEFSDTGIITFDGKAMRFANANGEDLLVCPGVILINRGDSEFALIDLREIAVESEVTKFVENDIVPEDSQIVGRTWAKVNRDGSPDRRFKDNYSIPVCCYGRLKFTSSTGLKEEYQFSNASASLAFGQALKDYQSALRSQGDSESQATAASTLDIKKIGGEMTAPENTEYLDLKINLPLLPGIKAADSQKMAIRNIFTDDFDTSTLTIDQASLLLDAAAYSNGVVTLFESAKIMDMSQTSARKFIQLITIESIMKDEDLWKRVKKWGREIYNLGQKSWNPELDPGSQLFKDVYQAILANAKNRP